MHWGTTHPRHRPPVLGPPHGSGGLDKTTGLCSWDVPLNPHLSLDTLPVRAALSESAFQTLLGDSPHKRRPPPSIAVPFISPVAPRAEAKPPVARGTPPGALPMVPTHPPEVPCGHPRNRPGWGGTLLLNGGFSANLKTQSSKPRLLGAMVRSTSGAGNGADEPAVSDARKEERAPKMTGTRQRTHETAQRRA